MEDQAPEAGKGFRYGWPCWKMITASETDELRLISSVRHEVYDKV